MASALTHIGAVTPFSAPVTVIGSANADLTVRVAAMPQPGQTIHGGPLAVLPGGKSANQAVAAALVGAPTSFIGAVGTDDNGSFLIDSLTRAGVSTEYVARVAEPTSCAIITVDSGAENMIVVTEGANDTVDVAAIEHARSAIESAKAVGLALEIPLAAVIQAAQLAHAAGAITVFNPSPMPESLPADLLEAIDVLIVNEGETEALVGAIDGDWTATEERIRALGVQRAVVTLGPRGAMVLENGATHVPIVDVPVVDTTGCGDAFTGGLLAVLANGHSLVEAAEFASIVASYASGGRGAQASYGTLEQISQAFAEN